TGELSGTPENGDVGDISITVTASDGEESTSDTFTLSVENTNDGPTVSTSISDQSTDEDAAFSLDVSSNFADEDLGDTLTYSATLENGSDLPDWITINSETGELSGTPENGDVGDISITVTASDGEESTSDTFTLSVENTNDGPTVSTSIDDVSTDEDAAFSLDVSSNFADEDLSDTLTYSATLENGGDLPEWITINSETGELSGTPENGDVGDISITVTASDGESSASDTFSISVENTNDGPSDIAVVTVFDGSDADFIPSEDLSVTENESGTIIGNVAVADVDSGDSHTLSVSDDRFEIVNGQLKLKDDSSIDYETETTVDVTITATDSAGSQYSETVTIDVENIGQNLTGTSETDVLIGGSLEDSITGLEGNDILIGGGGDDIISGGDGNDHIQGDGGADTLSGGEGDDTIYFNAEDTSIDGGEGTDTAIVSGSNDAVSLDLTDTSIESVTGAGGNDKFDATGSEEDVTAYGQGGYDILTGGEGDDTLSGGQDNDTITGKGGNDTAVYNGNRSDYNITENKDGSFTIEDTVLGRDGTDTVTGVETFSFLDGNYDSSIVESGNNSLIGQWKLDESTGQTAEDSIGDNDGTYENGVELGADGIVDSGTSAKFDGSSDYVEISHSSDFQLSEGTFVISFNPDEISGTQALFSRDSSSYDNGGHIDTYIESDGTLTVRIQSESNSYYISSEDGAVVAGENQQMAISFGPDGLELFLNGESVSTNSYTGGIEGNSEPITIGASQRGSGDETANNLKNFFDGTIDNFEVYDSQLSSSDVESLYNQIESGEVSLSSEGLEIAEPEVPELIGQWKLDESSDTTAEDSTGNNDGTYNNGVSIGENGLLKTGSAANFDGDNDYVEIAPSEDFQIDDGTFVMTFNADEISGKQTLFSRDSTNYDNGGHLDAYIESDGTLSVRFQSDSTSYYVSSEVGAIDAGTSHQIAFSFGSNGMELSLDGEIVDTNSYTGGIGGNNEPITIGASQWKSGDESADYLENYFSGTIDNLEIYNGQLSESAIDNLYEQVDQSLDYTIELEGDGTVDHTYDADTHTVTITDISGTNSNSTLTITDLDGNDLTVDGIDLNADLGTLISNVDLGDITISNGKNIATVTINDGDGSIDTIEYEGGTDSNISINGDVESITVSDIQSGNITVNGNLGQLSADIITGEVSVTGNAGTIQSVGSGHSADITGNISVGGDVDTLHAADDIMGDVDVTGNIGTLSAGDDIKGNTVTVGGDVGSLVVGDDITGDITIGGDLTSQSVGGLTSGSVSASTYGFNADTTVTEDNGNDTINTGSGDDTIDVGAGTNVINSGSGNDHIDATEGTNTVDAGDGDDIITFDDTSGFGSFDFGEGEDTLELDGAGITFDFTAIDNSDVNNLESIDISGSGANTLKLTADDVLDMTDGDNTIFVEGGSDDTVEISDTFESQGTESINGNDYTHYYDSGTDSHLYINNDISGFETF
ncbi:putative Ig domain-containing protein, partial [Puniceicoccaceae bacterium K14]|nr:putative Ig domain-containing protein [Puniceicoccaceae bacterium K14]